MANRFDISIQKVRLALKSLITPEDNTKPHVIIIVGIWFLGESPFLVNFRCAI